VISIYTLLWASLGSCVAALCILIYVIWLIRTRWPANGFVRVPRELRQETIRQASRAQGVAKDRTITASSTHVTDPARTRIKRVRFRR
jgi:hypothetical protein